MLNGIRIIEIEGLGPTPFAGMLFSDLGAEVTVIHRKDKSDFSNHKNILDRCLLYTSPSQRDLSTSRMPSSA